MNTHPLFAGIGGHQSARSKTDEWLTPPEIIAALGGAESFDLDPCAPMVQPYPTARNKFTKANSGLIQAWNGRVWLNPPYSDAEPWMARMAEHQNGTALIFARTETETFFKHVWPRASGIVFIRGRLNFHRADGKRAKGNSGAPSVLISYGHRDRHALITALREKNIDGVMVPL